MVHPREAGIELNSKIEGVSLVDVSSMHSITPRFPKFTEAPFLRRHIVLRIHRLLSALLCKCTLPCHVTLEDGDSFV